ncbi:hypothetical protein ABZP36_009947 [Zizania latifolia]
MKMSDAIGKTLVEDLDDVDLTLGRHGLIGPSKSDLRNYIKGFSATTKCTGHLTGILHDLTERSDSVVWSTSDVLYTLSKEDLLNLFQTVSSQLSFLWNVFLKFHRTNKIKILDHLRSIWDADWKSEWSIFIVHSKVDIPHHYLRSLSGKSSPRHSLLRSSSSRRIHLDPEHNSSSRAELHRRSIAQMKAGSWSMLRPGVICKYNTNIILKRILTGIVLQINARSVQDMQIYANPSEIPLVHIEHVMVVPQHGSSKILVRSASETNNASLLPKVLGNSVARRLNGGENSGHILRAVIFVHGFQKSMASAGSWG